MKKSFLQTIVLFGIFFVFTFQFLIPDVQAQGTYENVGSAPQQVETGQLSLVNTDSYWPIPFVWNNLPGVGKSDGLGSTVWNSTAGKAAAAGADWAAQGTIMPLIQTGAVFFLKIIQFGMWIAGGMFDMIVYHTIEDPRLITSLTQSIGTAWKIIRDIANIVIVFSLLYLGIKTILNGNGFAEGKVLVSILIAAVLINFSLVFTETVFKVSNMIGAQIGQQIVFSGQSTGYGGVHKISEGLMGMIRPDNIMAIMWKDLAQVGWAVMWDRVQVALITGTTMIFLMIIFIGAAILLMYRFIVFIVLMITSPIGLISKLVPVFNKAGDKWWSTLKSQAIVLPAFMLTLYISILFVAPFSRMLNPAASLTGSSISAVGVPGATTSASAAGAVQFFFNYLLIIGFLLLPLIVPGKVGAAGSDMMTNVADWTTKKIKSLPRSTFNRGARVAAGTSARAGRALIGRAIGGSLMKNETLRKKAQGTGAGAFFAQMGLKAGAGLQNRTYDVRNMDAVRKSSLGKEIGPGIKNWEAAVKEKRSAFETRKKEEMKLFGFDDLHKDPVAMANVIEAKRVRDLKKKEIDSMLKEFKKDTKADGSVKTDEERKDEGFVIANKQKDLEKLEQEVGRLQNIGEYEYSKQLDKRLLKVLNPKVTSRAGIAEMQKETQKKWKKEGQSTAKKKDAAAIASLTATPPAGGTPPAPTPPTPPTP